VDVTRWLAAQGFSATAPLDVEQPAQVDDCVVTFWRYYDQTGRSLPPPTVLATLLRQLHHFEPPPSPLPIYQPLNSFLEELHIHGPQVLTGQEFDFLHHQAADLIAAYDKLTSALGRGLIHGDARLGNLLWDHDSVVLGDWDSVSLGPRELDLVITYQGTRYGRTTGQLDDFSRAYGWDVRHWAGYPTLRAMRDLQTLGAPLRLAVDSSEVADELHHRIQGLMEHDDAQRWHPF
jgi:aminoglycoside phosphotransferase (APT) family kinase protein